MLVDEVLTGTCLLHILLFYRTFEKVSSIEVL